MRLWSLHPGYLDTKGLTALWREGLLAQKVLRGGTSGYRNHPQLDRFKQQADPLAAIAAYLREVHGEALRRGYRFDADKILIGAGVPRIRVTAGQVAHELAHLREKLKGRDMSAYQKIAAIETPRPHPLFEVVSGETEPWEIIKDPLPVHSESQQREQKLQRKH